MQNDNLASSGSETPAPEYVRPGGVYEVIDEIREWMKARGVSVSSWQLPDVLRREFDLLESQLRVKSAALTAAGEFITGLEYVGPLTFESGRSLLLAGRDTPREATASTEAKS